MSGKVQLQTLTLRQVLDGQEYGQWANPNKLAVPTPEKLKALTTNPLNTDEQLPSQVVAILDGEIVGSIDMIQGRVWVAGEPRTILWGSNLYVPPEHRHLAAGLGLLMQMQRSHPLVGVVGVSKMVHGVYQGLKWKEVVLPRVVAVRRSKPVLRSVLKNDVLGSLAAPFVDGILALQFGWRKGMLTKRLKDFQVEVTNTVPADLSEVYREGLPAFAPDRSRERLQWLLDNSFDDNPSRERLFSVVRTQSGELAGYVLVKKRHYDVATAREIKDVNLASVVDWGVVPGQGLMEEAMIVHGITFGSTVADIVEVPTGSSRSRHILRQLGMHEVGELNVFIKAAKGHEIDLDEESIQFLRPSDGDNWFA